MTISSSLNAGVMGLNVNATRLATISDNIANSATNGYKRSDVDFSSMVINQRPSVYSAGGVTARSFKDVTSSGSLISTGRSTDIAVNGDGMIPVTNFKGISEPGETRDFMMVPTGGFSPDENGFLRTTSGLFLLGWPVGSDGETISATRGSPTALEPVNTAISAFNAEATQNIELGVNLPANASASPGPYELPIEYYDSLGLAQNLTFNFERNTAAGAPANSWLMNVVDQQSGAAPVASFQVDFNDGQTNGGSLAAVTAGAGGTYDPATGELEFNLAGGPIKTKIGKIGSTEGLTQLGSTFSPYSVSKDGSPVGDLQSVEVTPEGFVEAVYNTGFRRKIYQVPVADVPNPDGMKALNNQAYALSPASGDLYLWDAGDGPAGEIAGYALMESNTDIAAELTSLIETQRAYSSNAKIIQTVDEMLQETTNLKR